MRGNSSPLLRCSLARKLTTNSTFFSCSRAIVIFCLPAGQSFWKSFVHTFWLPHALVLHAPPLSGMHSRSLSLELSRSYTLASAHLLVGECLFLLSAQASASFCWLARDCLFIFADRRVSLFTWRASDCLFLPVTDNFGVRREFLLLGGRRIFLTVTFSLLLLSPFSVPCVLSDRVCCCYFSCLLAG